MNNCNKNEFSSLFVTFDGGETILKERTFIEQPLPVNKSTLVETLKKHREEFFKLLDKALIVIILLLTAYCVFFPKPKIESMRKDGITLQLEDGHSFNLTAALDMVDSVSLTPDDKTGWSEISVPSGNTIQVRLPDGTLVHLNAASNLRFPNSFKVKKREVYIEGEAYFEVRPNPLQPFTVHTRNAIIKAFDTSSFNINTYDNSLHTSLLSGLVSVSVKEKNILLYPGQAAKLHNQLSVVSFERNMVLSWREGKYLFAGKSLQEVCKVVERWYNVNIAIDQEEVSQRHFYGAISKKRSINFFLEYLKTTANIDYYFDKKGCLHLNLK